MLASEYADTDLLYALPASSVLASERQAGRVAALLISLLGDEPELWNACARLAHLEPEPGTSFGQLLLSFAPA
jgi:hypothetical protein